MVSEPHKVFIKKVIHERRRAIEIEVNGKEEEDKVRQQEESLLIDEVAKVCREGESAGFEQAWEIWPVVEGEEGDDGQREKNSEESPCRRPGSLVVSDNSLACHGLHLSRSE